MSHNQQNMPPPTGESEQTGIIEPPNVVHVRLEEQQVSSESLAIINQALGSFGVQLALEEQARSTTTASPEETTAAQAESTTTLLLAKLADIGTLLVKLDSVTQAASAQQRDTLYTLHVAGVSHDRLAEATGWTTEDVMQAIREERAKHEPSQAENNEPTPPPVEPYMPKMDDLVYDAREGEFYGRVGVITGFYPEKGKPLMVYVRPVDFDGEHQAEWNARPTEVLPYTEELPAQEPR